MNPTGLIAASTDADLGAFTRVKLSSGKLVLAGLADGPGTELGTVEQQTFAATTGVTEGVTVRLRNVQGTRYMVAAGAISAAAKVYTAANGRVSATAASTAYLEGIALVAASAAGDIIEVATAPGEVANA